VGPMMGATPGRARAAIGSHRERALLRGSVARLAPGRPIR
jgi:hypothetical protein